MKTFMDGYLFNIDTCFNIQLWNFVALGVVTVAGVEISISNFVQLEIFGITMCKIQNRNFNSRQRAPTPIITI